jgi:hypothetical protein
MDKNKETAFDARSRRLCPDGSCLGLVGADGRCNICGRTAAPGGDAAAGPAAADPPDDDDFASAGDAGGGGDDVPAAEGFDPNRKLCEDGTCVGVIGSGGACTVCGRVASS